MPAKSQETAKARLRILISLNFDRNADSNKFYHDGNAAGLRPLLSSPAPGLLEIQVGFV